MICHNGHDTAITGRYANRACKACERDRHADRKRPDHTPKGVANKHAKPNPLAQLIPSWVPRTDEMVLPCHISTGWHKMTVKQQRAICQSCPLAAQCRDAGAGFTPAGEVWGGVLIGTPDHETPQVAA